MIVISDKEKAPIQAAAFDFIISILDKNYHWPHSFGDNHLIVRFEDTEHPSEKEHQDQFFGVNRILNWVKANKITSDHKVLVHCHAGVSRSAAVAWLLLIDQGVDPKEAFQSLFKARPCIWPNTNVMAIGDRLMGKQGEIAKLAHSIDLEIIRNRQSTGYSDYGG